MAKIEVTDEMVERFYEAYRRNDWPVFDSVAPRVRDGLEAVLNPPAPPEIPVSEAMMLAGADIFCKALNLGQHTALEAEQFFALEKIYRAMESERLKAARLRALTFERHTRKGEEPMYWGHRRVKDQPPEQGWVRTHNLHARKGEYTMRHRRSTDPNPKQG